MKLKTKILLGYSAVLTLVVFVCTWGVINLRRLGKASDAILQENYRSIIAAGEMTAALERQDSATLLVVLRNKSAGQPQFHQHEIKFLQWLGRAKDNITISNERQLLTAIETEYKNYLVAFSNIPQPTSASPTVNTSYYYETLLPQFRKVYDKSNDLRDLNQQTMMAASQQAQSISEQATWSMIFAGTAAAGIGLGFSLILSDRITHPLRLMMGATKQIADGEYEIVLPVQAKDEMGQLAQEITVMGRKLKAFHKLNVGKVIAERQRNDAIIHSIADGLVVIDDEFRVIAINPIAANILDVLPEKVRGYSFQEIVQNEALCGYMHSTAESGEPPQLDDSQSILELHRNQQTQYYKFAITPVKTEGNRRLGVVLLLQDITQLKEVDRLKSEFVATASHELRTPLTGMTMSMGLLLETAEEKLSESELELLQTAQDDMQRLRALVNDLLDLSKIESGKISLDVASVDVSLLIDNALSMFKVQVQDQGVELKSVIADGLPPVRADANKITWVLTNLIANALRYTERGGQIEVKVSPRADVLHICVRDDGAGIPLEYQSKIFDKFVQVETEKDVGGSGLGLAICKEIVKANQGSIWVESMPGQGSTFTFTLPIADRSSSATGVKLNV